MHKRIFYWKQLTSNVFHFHCFIMPFISCWNDIWWLWEHLYLPKPNAYQQACKRKTGVVLVDSAFMVLNTFQLWTVTFFPSKFISVPLFFFLFIVNVLTSGKSGFERKRSCQRDVWKVLGISGLTFSTWWLDLVRRMMVSMTDVLLDPTFWPFVYSCISWREVIAPTPVWQRRQGAEAGKPQNPRSRLHLQSKLRVWKYP